MQILDFYINDYKGEKIVIYGNEKMAYITTFCLQHSGIDAYCYASETGIYIAPYKNIISVEELSKLYRSEKLIIIFSLEDRLNTSIEILKKYNIDVIYSARNLWNSIDFKELCNNKIYLDIYNRRSNYFFYEDAVNNPDKVYVFSLDVVVTERCSLKCESCSNLMQYYCNPRNLDVDFLKNSIDIFLGKIDKLFELHILGGEPFMNLSFIKLIDAYLEESKIEQIAIFSNATIFPPEDILYHLINEKVFLRFSDYGELSYKLDTWIKWCNENHVRYVVEPIKLWQDLGRLERHNYSEYELWDIYGNCECRNIPTIIGDKLYNCPYAANASNLGAMIKSESEKDFICLNNGINKKDIENFLFNRKYLEACRYCNGRNMGRARIKPYIQTKRPLSYEKLYDKEDLIICETESNGKCNEPLLSVIVPVYNAANTIERCVKSILNSVYINIEVIIVNDGSIDNSLKLCESIAELDHRVKIINNLHAGVVYTRNLGISCAKGEYITFVDADDYISLEHYRNMMKDIDDCDIVIGRYMKTNLIDYSYDPMMSRGQGKFRKWSNGLSEGVYTGDMAKSFKMHQFQFCRDKEQYDFYIWNKIFKTDIVKKVYGRVAQNLINGEDQILYHMCLLESKKIKSIKEYGYFHTESISGNEKRYPYEDVLKNRVDEFFIMRKYIDEEYKEDDKEVFIKNLNEYYMQWLVVASSRVAPYIFIKYPYYGRFQGKDKVVLYGAGNAGRVFYKEIIEEAVCQLVAWVDKNAKQIRKTTMLPVRDVECISDIDFDYIIIAVLDKTIFEEIEEEIIKKGIAKEKIIWSAVK